MEGKRGGNGTDREHPAIVHCPGSKDGGSVNGAPLEYPPIRGILFQMHGAGEFDSPLPRLGIPVQKSPLPFHLTPFDPRSEISQCKPCYTPPIPPASPFHPRVRCGHSACHLRSFPEHASNESRTRPLQKHLIFEATLNYACNFIWPSSFWKP